MLTLQNGVLIIGQFLVGCPFYVRQLLVFILLLFKFFHRKLIWSNYQKLQKTLSHKSFQITSVIKGHLQMTSQMGIEESGLFVDEE